LDPKEQQVRSLIIQALHQFTDPQRPTWITESGRRVTSFAYPSDLPPDEMGFEAEAMILAVDEQSTWDLAEHLLQLCRLYKPEWIARSHAETTDWDAALGQPGGEDPQ
jgi:hypothetical protein